MRDRVPERRAHRGDPRQHQRDTAAVAEHRTRDPEHERHHRSQRQRGDQRRQLRRHKPEHRAVQCDQRRRSEMIQPQPIVGKVVHRHHPHDLRLAEKSRPIIPGELLQHARARRVVRRVTASQGNRGRHSPGERQRKGQEKEARRRRDQNQPQACEVDPDPARADPRDTRGQEQKRNHETPLTVGVGAAEVRPRAGPDHHRLER